MRNLTENLDGDLISYGDDLIKLLKVKNGFESVSQSLDHFKAIRIACDDDFNQIQSSIQDCKKKLDDCKKKIEEQYSEDDIEHLEKQLEAEIEEECKLKEQLRVVAYELKDMSTQSTSIVEQRQSIKRKDRDESRAEKKLSMYASVTKVIPDIDDDDPSMISGYMVNTEKKVLEKFKFETNKMTAYETCNNIWSIISKQ